MIRGLKSFDDKKISEDFFGCTTVERAHGPSKKAAFTLAEGATYVAHRKNSRKVAFT